MQLFMAGIFAVESNNKTNHLLDSNDFVIVVCFFNSHIDLLLIIDISFILFVLFK